MSVFLGRFTQTIKSYQKYRKYESYDLGERNRFFRDEQETVINRLNSSNAVHERYDKVKGGEILHFRHFLISGLMVGAVLFLPDNAFAVKNELSGQRLAEKASAQAANSVKADNAAVQANVPKEVENSNALGKNVVVPEPASKGQAEVKEKPSKVTPTPSRAALDKPDAVLDNVPDQAKGNVQSAVKKAKKVVGLEKATAAQEKTSELVGNKPTPKKVTNESASDSLHNTDTVAKNKAQLGKLVSITEPEGTVSTEKNSSDPFVPEPVKQGKVPASQEEIPKVNQVMNPTQRTNSSGGQSNDRVSNGLSTISLLDKWFEWHNNYEIKLVQPYLSRYALMNNQWVNAPPAPPPQEAPLLKTVTRS